MFGATSLATTASADDPAIYTNKGFDTSQTWPTTDNVSYTTWLEVNGQSGPFAVSNSHQPNSNAIIDTKQINSATVSQGVELINHQSTSQHVNFSIMLPTAFSDTFVLGANWKEQFAEQGITEAPNEDSPDQGIAFFPKENSSREITSFHVQGDLKAHQDLKLKLPLAISEAATININTPSIEMDMYFYDSTGSYDAYTYARFGNVVRDSDGTSPLDSTGRYVAYSRDSTKRAILLPNDIQQLMPQMNKNDIKINNFLSGNDPTDYQNASDSQWYTGGKYFLQLDRIQEAVRNSGYSVLPSNENLSKYYAYFNVGSAAKDVYYPSTNNEFKEFDLYGKDGYGTIPVELRQVIKANHDNVTLPIGAKWNPYSDVTVYAHDGSQISLPNADVTVAGAPTDMTKDGTYQVTYTYTPDKVSKTITVVVGKGSATGGNTGGTTGSTTSNTTNNGSTGDVNNNSNNSTNTGSTSTTTTTKPSTSVSNGGSNIAVKGEAVYATKKIGLYKNIKFTKANRIAWYPKQKRVNRPMFVVTGYKRAANGALRYKVRDVNHGRKTAGKTGYITASRKYVVPVYYASVPKSKKITVISPKGVNTYKSANLTGKAKHYKKGVRLTVKKLVKHNLTTRYQLSNGHFVTTNKKLVIAGNY
ncbi:hypothetical protein FC85_GL002413 [Lentilactobacillus diolivorans DSM 14421]|uniref:DUF5776 domain-containing protein n=2 Tax=Lentilactobacillus diolivorans TaxID=179838 RepID=A0A0R1SQF4_9LACO|nr:hypothetical protein FC85_GL002413 [Lentilactobacillus diolivorans DSM 14421]